MSPKRARPGPRSGDRQIPPKAGAGLLARALALSVVLGLLRALDGLGNAWLYALALWPGTLMHELAHWGMAWLLGAEPHGMQLWPTRLPDGRWLLGSVQFVATRWNVASVALAPLLLVPLGAGWMWLSLRLTSWPPRLFCLYAAACAWGSSWPSSIDWQLAWQAPLSWPLAGLFLLLSGWGFWRLLRRTWQRSSIAS